MTQMVGREAILHVLAQSSPGAAASGNYIPVPHFGITPRRADPLEAQPLIQSGQHNVMDNQAPAQGLITAGLDLDLPFCLNNLGLFLPHFLIAAAPTGVGPYVHAFTSGAREHNGLSLGWADGDDWQLANTFTGSRLDFSFGQLAGTRRLRVSGMCSDIENPDANPFGAPLAPLAQNFLAGGLGCIVRRNGVQVSRITGGSASFERQLDPHRPSSRAFTAESFTPQVGTGFSGTLEMRSIDNTFRDEAAGKIVDDMEFEYAIDSDNKLVISCPAVRFEPAPRPVGGEGLRTETWRFVAEQTSAAPMFTATLTNAVDSYPVAA